MRTFATLFLLFVGLISSSAQFYNPKSEQEIWEEEQNAKNNYDEYLTKHAYVYDEEEGRELAAKKKETLKKALEFYDSQISIVERWIEKRKVTANKFNAEIPLNYETMKNVILLKMLILNKYEKNLSDTDDIVYCPGRLGTGRRHHTGSPRAGKARKGFHCLAARYLGYGGGLRHP
jgi:hypothetical protein